MPGAIIPIIAGLATAVGAGMSYFAATSAADTQATLAASNAQTQLQGIEQQRQTSQMAASINQALAEKDKAAANTNADADIAQADANSAAARSATRSSRLEAAKFMASQRAALAKGGFDASTGSPLALLADTAQKSQQEANRLTVENEASSRALFREASAERNQGVLAGINATGAQIAGVTAANNATRGAAQAKLDLYGQQAAANAARTNATAGLFTAFGGIAGNAYTMFKKTPAMKPVYPKAYPV